MVARRHIPAWHSRVLTRAEAAEYVGMDPKRFTDLVRDGALPPQLDPERYGRDLWDRLAIDDWIDAASGRRASSGKKAEQHALDLIDGASRRAVHS
jgi:hypothetical protein